MTMRLSSSLAVALSAASLVALSLPSALAGCSATGHSSPAAPGAPDAAPTSTGSFPDSGVTMVGQIDGGVTTTLPPLPAMTSVVATLGDDSASITFDPVDGALDYRVYALPADGDVDVMPGGQVVVKNAIYHCAGFRETPAPNVEDAGNAGSWVTTLVNDVTVGGFHRTMADATLGYVYTQPGPGLVAVHALGESDPYADNGAYFARWGASRTKSYTTSDAEVATLLASFARDDGIAFYVPATKDGTTRQVYLSEDGVGTKFRARYYVADGPEAAAHETKTAVFSVLASQAPGTVPLMRVFYQNNSGWSHDELAAGLERFNRIYRQGDQQPWWSLLFTGLTGKTTLVVEALDAGCPFQGHLSPQSVPSMTAWFGSQPLIHQPYVTLDEVRAASATTEVFLNGQHGPAWQWNGADPDAGLEDAATDAQLVANSGAGLRLPRAVARAFVDVTPVPHAAMEFFAAFPPSALPEAFTSVPCGSPDGNCFATWRQQSATFDQMFMDVEYGAKSGSGQYAFGPVLGELWVTYADVGADTNGKYRLTANQKATMSASGFLHVTMEVDGYSTARRYPQILISDQVAPVQYTLAGGHTLIVQPRGEVSAWLAWPIDMDLQICSLRTWDVNNQCPQYDLYHQLDDAGNPTHLLPGDEVGEHASADHRMTFDVYASTARAYIFLDQKPYACANLPAAAVPTGPVTVTWGDVLYHSAVDSNLAFHRDHMQIEQRRHFDNLGFSSGVAAPGWDESRLPCAAPIAP